MISKERLVFDTANADQGDVVASFLKSADGTLLTHTTVGGKEALDVNITNAIEVSLDAAADSVQAWAHDGTGNAIGSTGGALHISDAGGSLTVDATDLDIRNLVFATDKVDVSGSSVTVTATDLDIRDLAFATDSVDVSGSSVSITGDVNVTQGTSPWVVSATNLDIRDLAFATDKVDVTGSSVTVSATDLDIRDLSSATDSVTAIQGTSPWVVSDAALAATSLTSTQKDVTSTTGALLASQAASRKYLLAQNLGNRSIFVGASGVSIASGIRLSPGSSIELRLGAALSLHAVTDSGTQDIRLLEVA